MSDELWFSFYAGCALAGVAVAMLMLIDAKRRFSLKWLLVFTAVLAVILGSGINALQALADL